MPNLSFVFFFFSKRMLGDHKIDNVRPAKRGLNFLVVDPQTAEVVSSGSFDTYDSG